MKFRALMYVLLGLGATCIVAAILFPVFAKARMYSGPSCLGNIHQLSVALLVYDNDDGALPPATSWMDHLVPLIHSERAFHCPVVLSKNRFAYGYSMQTRLGGEDVSHLPTPAKEPMVFDSFPIGRNGRTNNPIIPGFSRHGGQNVGYADGHAKFLKRR